MSISSLNKNPVASCHNLCCSSPGRLLLINSFGFLFICAHLRAFVLICLRVIKSLSCLLPVQAHQSPFRSEHPRLHCFPLGGRLVGSHQDGAIQRQLHSCWLQLSRISGQDDDRVSGCFVAALLNPPVSPQLKSLPPLNAWLTFR